MPKQLTSVQTTSASALVRSARGRSAPNVCGAPSSVWRRELHKLHGELGELHRLREVRRALESVEDVLRSCGEQLHKLHRELWSEQRSPARRAGNGEQRGDMLGNIHRAVKKCMQHDARRAVHTTVQKDAHTAARAQSGELETTSLVLCDSADHGPDATMPPQSGALSSPASSKGLEKVE